MNTISHKGLKALFVGASGTGKTNAFLKFVYGSDYDHYFIFDHQGEILDRLVSKGLEIEPFFDFESISEYYQDDEANEEGVSNVILFDPYLNFAGEYEECFENFCTLVFEACDILQGTKLIVCDELQILTGNLHITKPLQRILQTGRRKQLDCAFCSQAPNELHNKIRNQITHLIAFRTMDKNALQWIRDIQLPDFQRLMNLQDGHAIVYDAKNSTEAELVIDLST